MTCWSCASSYMTGGSFDFAWMFSNLCISNSILLHVGKKVKPHLSMLKIHISKRCRHYCVTGFGVSRYFWVFWNLVGYLFIFSGTFGFFQIFSFVFYVLRVFVDLVGKVNCILNPWLRSVWSIFCKSNSITKSSYKSIWTQIRWRTVTVILLT